ncbi:MAG TPA: hypothetical protein ENI23_02665 [bacterium]|nr:hypothetical protein [bacterium]
MTQLENYKKTVFYDNKVFRELGILPKLIHKKIDSLINELSEFGALEYPDGKKIVSTELFEMRVRISGVQWRLLYAYVEKDRIIILNLFKKKTQKTPKKELRKASNRLRVHKQL